MSSKEYPETDNKRTIKVLVVDDEESIREALRMALEMRGIFSIREAADGKEALKKVIQSKPDVIILDVEMPEMDGLQAHRELKRDPQARDIPVIFLSAKPYKDIAQTVPIGVDEYMEKPLGIKELYAKIDKVIERSKE